MPELYTPEPSSPWAVTTTKRKTPTSISAMNGAAARKRQRLSTEPGRRNREWQKQQTLTQIQWVPSDRGVNFKDRHEHGDGLEFIDYGNDPITSETAVKVK